eukprot:525360-Prymnesium_polylepis.1
MSAPRPPSKREPRRSRDKRREATHDGAVTKDERHSVWLSSLVKSHVPMAYDAPGGGVGRYARPA